MTKIFLKYTRERNIMEEIIKRYLRKIYYNLKTCALWLFMAVLTGVAVGAFSSAFSFCLKKVTTLQMQRIFNILSVSYS